MESILTKKQEKKFSREFYRGGERFKIVLTIRYDDECGNGHNTFAMTGDIYENRRGAWKWYAGGCCHEEIAAVFPEYARYLKWHLCASDGPLHYLSNTLFLAGNRDCWGKLKGEPYHYENKIKFSSFPVVFKFNKKFVRDVIRARKENSGCKFNILAVEHEKRPGENYNFEPKYTFDFKDATYAWHECPFDELLEAKQFCEAFNTLNMDITSEPTSWGEGKEPELEAARHAAIWPEATIEQLNDKAALEARLPELLAEFKKDVESLGFVY